MKENSPKVLKTQWEMEKLLVTGKFSLSHCVLKRLVLRTRKNKDLFGKGDLLVLCSSGRVYKVFENIVNNDKKLITSQFSLLSYTISKFPCDAFKHFVHHHFTDP